MVYFVIVISEANAAPFYFYNHQVAWAHPRFGSILASCSYDRKIILWREDRPGSWYKMEEFTNHDSSVNSIRSVGFAGTS